MTSCFLTAGRDGDETEARDGRAATAAGRDGPAAEAARGGDGGSSTRAPERDVRLRKAGGGKFTSSLFLFPHGQLDTDVVFCVQAKWDEREDETLTAIGVEVDAIRRSKDVIKSSTGGASAVPTIQVAGECHAVTLPYSNAQLPPNH